MESGDYEFIWEASDWPRFRYDLARLAQPMAQVHQAQGHFLGRLEDAGLGVREQTTLQALTSDVLKTSEIEGEMLDVHSVRSSLARRLGMDIGALAPADRHVEGVVDMVVDATVNHAQPLTAQRLFGWHAALFPTGYSSLTKIRTGAWRDDASGPMQVVSGPIGREKVHYQAPPAERLVAETRAFIEWFDAESGEPPLIKAGLAHLWFVTLHPFEDGNGRISRALGDMALARWEGRQERFYSLSAQIQRERADYYDMLESTQKGSMDVTRWLAWFLACLGRAIAGSEAGLTQVLARAAFWRHWGQTPFNARQIKVLNRLQDGFHGKLTSTKWASMTKCSGDTALRDLSQLVEWKVLRRSEAGGRSTSYELAPFE